MSLRTESLLIACHPDGSFRGASLTKLIIDEQGEAVASRQFPISEAEVSAAFAGFNSQMMTQRDALQLQVETLASDLEIVTLALAARTAKVAELEAELEALKNPPNPFPNADWAGFRSGVLMHPAYRRVALASPDLAAVLVWLMGGLQDDPSKASEIAALWTTMENNEPLTIEEVDAINGIAATCNVPLRLSATGAMNL